MVYDQNSLFGYLHDTGYSFAPKGGWGVAISFKGEISELSLNAKEV